MPLYDYICDVCRQRFDIFMSYQEYGARPVICPHCRSEKVRRRISRPRVLKSDDARLESLADPSALEGLEDDPQALGRMMRKMGSELGEELPPEFDEVVDRLEKGQSPDEIEKDLPDLGAGLGATDDL